ncbi:abortive infection family protein [Candidatus Latescibacterota bacterium]
MHISYSRNPDINELYQVVSKALNLSSKQHEEPLFKQILGGCSSIVSGLGKIRNRMGDAHGKGRLLYRPTPRHAELAINLSGSMVLFLLQTYEASRGGESPPYLPRAKSNRCPTTAFAPLAMNLMSAGVRMLLR